jgi:hypothetical protein
MEDSTSLSGMIKLDASKLFSMEAQDGGFALL